MKLYLARHAEAESGLQMDPTRKLTATGKAQSRMMGKWLKHQLGGPALVIESNFQRSISTAKRIAKRIDAPIVRSGALDPDALVDSAWRAIKNLAKENKVQRVVAVTHGPVVENLLALLIGSPLPQYLTFAHATIAHLETVTDNHANLQWIVTPNVVARDQDQLDLVTHDASAMVEAALAVAEAAVACLPDEAQGEYTYDEIEQKRLILGDGGKSGNCDWCEEAADRGWVDMDDVFEGPDGDVDDAPLHIGCTCSVEQKTRRVRVYESGLRVMVED